MAMKSFKKNNGFTLIELLVGMFIIIVSATAVVVLLSSSFRISNKTTLLASVRENGNNAINLMQRTIQFADGFSGVSNDGINYSTDCTTMSSPAYLRLRSGATTSQFFCSGGSLTYTPPGSVVATSLINNDNVSVSCALTCSQANINTAPVIGITLNISLVNPKSLPEKNASFVISTSVKMRNL